MLQKVKDFVVFRDDLYPFLGGGNKGRKMDAIAAEISKQEANSLVTTGGIQSNHCRAVAVYAAQHQLKCSLVLHGSQQQFYEQTGNAKIMRASGAEIHFVDDATQIAGTMELAMSRYQEQGLRPYYIWGGGHTLEGGKAYIDAVAELNSYCTHNQWRPSFIFLASGTGSTQAGILAGLDKYDLDCQVIGISVGRKTEQAERIVADFYQELCSHYTIRHQGRSGIVLDDYLCGGYGKYNDALKALCESSVRDFGFTLDTCYTGKAFYGMQDYMQKNSIRPSDVLFWHTGGIFNFLAE